jgi:hypothetical protein
MYQPLNTNSTTTGMTSSQYQDSSQSPNYLYHQSNKQPQYPKYQDTISSNQCSPKLNQLSVTVPSNSINPSQYQSPATASTSNQMSGGILSPNQFQQLLQVITTQNQTKQYITTDSQTSPTNETAQNFNFSKYNEQLTISPSLLSRQQSPKLNVNSQNNSLIQIVKSNASSQTDLKEKPHENKEVNTDPIKHPSMVSASTNTLPPPPPAPLLPPPPPPPPQPAPKKTRNQAINVNLYEETVVKNEKHFEEKVCLFFMNESLSSSNTFFLFS